MDRRDRRRHLEPRQRVSTVIHLVIAWSFGFLFLATVVLQEAVPAETLLLDRAVVSGGRWYDGMVTSVGILAWTVAACACAGAAFSARLGGRSGATLAFGSAAIMIAALMLDDLFLLHSSVAPKLLGVSKLTVIAAEGLVVVIWIARSVGEIRRTRWELLVASGVAFAVSNAVDIVAVIGDDRWRLIVEDGAKFFGVLALASWAVTTAGDITRSVVVGSPIEAERQVVAGRPPVRRSRPAPAVSATPTQKPADQVVCITQPATADSGRTAASEPERSSRATATSAPR